MEVMIFSTLDQCTEPQDNGEKKTVRILKYLKIIIVILIQVTN